MKSLFPRVARAALALAIVWLTAAMCHAIPTNRSTASTFLLLEIVLIATLADWYLSLVTSAGASLAFSWYFIDGSGTLRITTIEGAVTFFSMVITAITVSHVAVRSRQRASEAERRREEMERLQRFSSELLTAETVAEAAEKAVVNVVFLFGLRGASVRLAGSNPSIFRFGDESGRNSVVTVENGSEFVLYGPLPSAEVRSALGNVMHLVIDRARATEERAHNEATERGEKLQTTILNALAHNFKTPLTSIKAASSSLLRSTEFPTEESKEMVTVIDEEADRLDQLITESLDLARIEAHRANPRLEHCSISSIVDAVTERSARYMSGRDLVISIPQELPPVAGDRFLFEQMVMQVVDNAWKYSKPGARIEISAASEKDKVILTIRNEGSAIPDDEKEKIFGKFYRGAVNRSQVEGTGLGLAIARAIADAHRGAIWLDSEPQGPAFRFALPVEVYGEKE